MKKKRRKPKQKRKPIHIIIAICIFLICVILGLKFTEDGTYTLHTTEKDITYHHFIFSKLHFLISDDESATITNEDDKLVMMHKGIIDLATKDITQNTSYTLENKETGYTNGQYGADAYYLDTSWNGKKILAKISGIKAWFSIEDVELHTLDEPLYLSYYFIKDGTLYHSICTNIHTGSARTLPLNTAPDFLQEGKVYYSYDGNTFYESIDFREPVNKKTYYNFYQYIPHRSKSNITDEQLDAFLASKGYAGISILEGQGKLFTSLQDRYTLNSTMIYALALNESAFGTSDYAINNHNLFGHAAYDADPDQANAYTSIQTCLESHATHFLNERYANPDHAYYRGSWFGNKASGMNVNYASDPYWGEKAASYYYQIDAANGLIDQTNIQLKTQISKQDIYVYSDRSRSSIVYKYNENTPSSFVVENTKTKLFETWYTVFSEKKNNSSKDDPYIGYIREDECT